MSWKFKTPKATVITSVILVGFVLICFCTSCSGNEDTIDEALLTRFHSLAHPQNTKQPSEQVDCYIDYSDGMQPKINAALVSFKNLSNLLKGKDHVIYYRVGAADSVKLIPDINSSDAKLENLKNYTDNVSKLKPALDNIIRHTENTAIFITDFEQIYPGTKIDVDAWAQLQFKDWLINGNQIDIFATPYVKGNLQNWIYTLVFTPASIIADEAQYRKSIVRFLEENLSTENKHFTYTAADYKIEGETDEAMGDANDNITPVYNITKTRANGFEYYEFSSGDILSFLSDGSLEDKRIINKLKIIPTGHIFSKMDFDIKTYDITKSVSAYSASLNQETPEVKEDAESGAQIPTKKPPKYRYEPGASVEHVFEIKPHTNHAIGIKLDPDFTGVDATTIYKVDVILKSLEMRDFEEENKVLKINYGNTSINPLGESLGYAIKNIKNEIEGKPIYTIYIKIDK